MLKHNSCRKKNKNLTEKINPHELFICSTWQLDLPFCNTIFYWSTFNFSILHTTKRKLRNLPNPELKVCALQNHKQTQYISRKRFWTGAISFDNSILFVRFMILPLFHVRFQDYFIPINWFRYSRYRYWYNWYWSALATAPTSALAGAKEATNSTKI